MWIICGKDLDSINYQKINKILNFDDSLKN